MPVFRLVVISDLLRTHAAVNHRRPPTFPVTHMGSGRVLGGQPRPSSQGMCWAGPQSFPIWGSPLFTPIPFHIQRSNSAW